MHTSYVRLKGNAVPLERAAISHGARMRFNAHALSMCVRCFFRFLANESFVEKEKNRQNEALSTKRISLHCSNRTLVKR